MQNLNQLMLMHVKMFCPVCLAELAVDKPLFCHKAKYNITSMARTRMVRLPWKIRTLFSVPTKFFQ